MHRQSAVRATGSYDHHMGDLKDSFDVSTVSTISVGIATKQRETFAFCCINVTTKAATINVERFVEDVTPELCDLGKINKNLSHKL
jgi:hypothetical protein